MSELQSSVIVLARRAQEYRVASQNLDQCPTVLAPYRIHDELVVPSPFPERSGHMPILRGLALADEKRQPPRPTLCSLRECASMEEFRFASESPELVLVRASPLEILDPFRPPSPFD